VIDGVTAAEWLDLGARSRITLFLDSLQGAARRVLGDFIVREPEEVL